ncbi:hypothetical protein RRG08_058545 [Elysia crispata]|uniref:Uncharacterized protein n=1 Tax=Elysia crispata TaxID=231223 RepID=A0AAE1AGW0_9GAST|nr:hypothetical protein RRG08_058545 [Elysia crispata]
MQYLMWRVLTGWHMSIDDDSFPNTLSPPGLTPERKWYLFNEIRCFVSDEHKEKVAPIPDCSEPRKNVALGHHFDTSFCALRFKIARPERMLSAAQAFDEIFRDTDSDDEDFDSSNSNVTLREVVDDSDEDYTSDLEEDEVLQSDSGSNAGERAGSAVPKTLGRTLGITAQTVPVSQDSASLSATESTTLSGFSGETKCSPWPV